MGTTTTTNHPSRHALLKTQRTTQHNATTTPLPPNHEQRSASAVALSTQHLRRPPLAQLSLSIRRQHVGTLTLRLLVVAEATARSRRRSRPHVAIALRFTVDSKQQSTYIKSRRTKTEAPAYKHEWASAGAAEIVRDTVRGRDERASEADLRAKTGCGRGGYCDGAAAECAVCIGDSESIRGSAHDSISRWQPDERVCV